MSEYIKGELRVDAYCSECNAEKEYTPGTEDNCEACGGVLEVTGVKDEIR